MSYFWACEFVLRPTFLRWKICGRPAYPIIHGILQFLSRKNLSDSRLNCYSPDYIWKIYDYYVNVLNDFNQPPPPTRLCSVNAPIALVYSFNNLKSDICFPDTMSASLSSLVSLSITELHCSVCLSVFEDPKLLPCSHTYCLACLEDITRQSASNHVKCPECRENVLVSLNYNSIKWSNIIAMELPSSHFTSLLEPFLI